MGITIDTSQVRALSSRLNRGAGRLGARASAVVSKTAYAMQADYQAGLIAMDAVDTGNLLNSASTTITGDGRSGQITAEIGPTAEYGIYVEQGTSVMPGRPALANAFDRNMPGYTEALAGLIDEDL